MENLETKINTKEIISVTLSFLLIISLAVIFLISYKKEKTRYYENAGTLVEVKKDYFQDISLEAKSAYVWDAKEGKALFAKNEQAQLPLASVTKLMTALVVSDIAPDGTIVTIEPDDIWIEGDSGLRVGEKWKLSDILDFTLVSSSNDGAHALASVIGSVKQKEIEEKTPDEIFIDEMNKKARELGLTQTFYLSESGLDLNEGMSGSYGSARDMAILMDKIVLKKPYLLEATKYPSLEVNSKEYNHSVSNTNQEVAKIPGIIGSKTGFTDLAGGNLVVAFDVGMGHPIIISVLGSSKEGRFEDVMKLVNASIEAVAE